jgi:drug/metabolite transporter (DMT)-like permease
MPWVLALATLSFFAAFVIQLYAIKVVHISYFEACKRALGVIFSMGLGWWVFREALSRRKLISGSLMALGVLLVAL